MSEKGKQRSLAFPLATALLLRFDLLLSRALLSTALMNPPPPRSIELARVRLRPATVADADAIFEYGSDPIVARYTDWTCLTQVEPLIESLQRRESTWGQDQDYSWVMATLTEDRAIGGVRCHISGNAAEIGFLLNRRFWGQGYAGEAAGAVMDWLFSLPEIDRVWATCDPENAASIRVLEKLGLEREQVLRQAIVRPQISPEPRDAYLYVRHRGQPRGKRSD